MKASEIIPKLQSRIDLRRNRIRAYEVDVSFYKTYIKERGLDTHGTREHIKVLRNQLATLVSEQVLDKRLYGMALDVEREVRFYVTMFDSMTPEFE
jgi:hypothetical protein